MSDLTRRLREVAALEWPVTYEVQQRLNREAADRIEADEALLRQALAYILSDGDFLAPDAVESTRQLIAAIRARLNGQAEET